MNLEGGLFYISEKRWWYNSIKYIRVSAPIEVYADRDQFQIMEAIEWKDMDGWTGWTLSQWVGEIDPRK